MIFPPHQILWGRLIKEDVMSGERRAYAYEVLVGNFQRTDLLEDVSVEIKIVFNITL